MNEVKSNTRATWGLLNEILSRKTSKVKSVSTFKIDGKDISDPLTIANKFCEYFSNIGPSLTKGITSTSCHRAFLLGTFVQSIFLAPATKNEILTITNSFLTGKAYGRDNLPMSVIKRFIDIISVPLTSIVNMSLSHGIVPDKMKIARVIPVYKSGDRAIFSNYRPISVLPSFSKILEKVVYNRIIEFINKLNILCDNQYGFRKNYSTSLALIEFYGKVSSAFDRGEVAVGIFLDLSKAFDTANHDILFDKLRHYWIRGVALDWVKSYFSIRLQYVDLNGNSSSLQKISRSSTGVNSWTSLFYFIYQ